MIYYIGYFDFQDSGVQRKYVVSATNKMEYIAKAINSIGYDIEIVSLSLSNKSGFKYHKGETKSKNGINAHFFPTFDAPIYWKWLKNCWRFFCLLFWGYKHLSSDDIVISYHTTSNTSPLLSFLRKKKGFRLVLEVEEVYSDVAKVKKHIVKREYDAFNHCDGFIFSTEMLGAKLNNQQLPNVVIYGTYNVEKVIARPDNDYIHVVYAGTFDKRKGGAAAAAAVEYLPSNYMIHICGFGKPGEVEEIKSIVKALQDNGHNIQYEGLLKGTDYIKLLQRCSIGLSTQDPAAQFNNTSFPSKILSYMSNGLSVVSIRIEAVVNSKIGDYIEYYEEQTPEQIAACILSVGTKSDNDNRAVISTLDSSFKDDVKYLINKLS